jgi:hypothetical protein
MATAVAVQTCPPQPRTGFRRAAAEPRLERPRCVAGAPPLGGQVPVSPSPARGARRARPPGPAQGSRGAILKVTLGWGARGAGSGRGGRREP